MVTPRSQDDISLLTTSSIPRGGGQLEAVGLTQSTWDQTVIRATWKLGQVGQHVVGTASVGLPGIPLCPSLDSPPQHLSILPYHPQSPQHPLTQKIHPVSCRQVSSVTSVHQCCPSPFVSPLPTLLHPHGSRRRVHQPAPHTASPYLSHPHTSLYTPCPISKLPRRGLLGRAGIRIFLGLSLGPAAWQV